MQEHISIPQPCSLGHTAAVCHNLRPVVRNTKPTALEAATAPSVFINSGNWRPLAAVDIDGTRRLLLSKGHIIASADPEAVSQPAPDEYTGVRLPGDALCAVPDNGSALIMTPEGAVRLSPQTDGTAILRGCSGDYPAVIIYGEDGAGISESTQGCSLSMIYGDGESLRGSDRRRMSDDVADTYSRLAARAAALGAFIQPVLCGYKLYDRRGNLLVASEPMLIGALAGAQCTGIVEAAYDRDSLRVRPVALHATSWRPVVGITPQAVAHPLAAAIARCEVWISPQFHPFDPDAAASPFIGTRNGTNDIRVYLPGRSNGLSEATYGTSESILRDAVARFDTLAVCAATIHNPFAAEGSIVIDAPREDSAAATHRRLAKALDTPVAFTAPEQSRLEAPHAFSAACCSASAGCVAWGDITALRFKGWPVETFAAASDPDSGAWHAALAVGFASGNEKVVSVSQGLSHAPTALKAMLSYPSPDATEMTVILSRGGKVYRQTFPLRPDASGRRAVYVDRTFRPVFPAEDPDGIFAVPAPAQAPLPMPSAIVLASSVDPLTPIVVVRGAAGRIKAIVAANAGNQAWEYGRNRFIAATTSGIYSLTADLPRRSCSMRMLDSRGTARGDAVCAAGAYIRILAKDTSGRTDLLETSAAGNIKTVASDLPYDIIGLNGARNELWLADSRHPDSVKAFVADAATYRGFTVDPPGIVAFTVCGGSCYALTSDGALLALDRDAMPRSVRIALTARPDIGAGRFTPRFVMLHCSSGAIDGTLTIKATGHGTAPKAVLSRLKISGALRSSLLCRLVSPPREGLETTLEADVSGDFRITAITTGYDTRRN